MLQRFGEAGRLAEYPIGLRGLLRGLLRRRYDTGPAPPPSSSDSTTGEETVDNSTAIDDSIAREEEDDDDSDIADSAAREEDSDDSDWEFDVWEDFLKSHGSRVHPLAPAWS